MDDELGPIGNRLPADQAAGNPDQAAGNQPTGDHPPARQPAGGPPAGGRRSSPTSWAGGASLRYGNPWADPPEARDPLRRLRGRLVLPVTVWLAGAAPPPGAGTPASLGPAPLAGITVSSVVLSQGGPPMLAGLISPTSDVADLIAQPPGRFVVHLLHAEHRRLAEHFGGDIPAPPEMLATRPSAHGPALEAVADRLYCRAVSHEPFGWSLLVLAEVEATEVGPAGKGLAWYHGQFHTLGPGAR